MLRDSHVLPGPAVGGAMGQGEGSRQGRQCTSERDIHVWFQETSGGGKGSHSSKCQQAHHRPRPLAPVDEGGRSYGRTCSLAGMDYMERYQTHQKFGNHMFDSIPLILL